MKKLNAQKLQHTIASEAIALLCLESETIEDTSIYEQAVTLIGEVWGIPKETTREQLALIQQERAVIHRRVAGEHAEDVIDNIFRVVPGREILSISKGLFETSVHVKDHEQRLSLFNLAGQLEECLRLDEWINRVEDEKPESLAPDQSITQA